MNKSEEQSFRILKIESKILFIDTQIRSSLGLDKADVDMCIDALEELSKYEMTQLMIKKHPHLVSTIRPLRGYIGNVAEWQLNQEQLIIFNKKSKEIRIRATNIFVKIMALFKVTNEKAFDASFNYQMTAFKKATSHMNEEQINSLVIDPTFKSKPAKTQ